MTVYILAVIDALIIGLLLYGYLSNYLLVEKKYQINSLKVKGEPVRVILLADLHGMVFGKQNSRLIQKIKKNKPDIICIAGDMIVKDGKGIVSCLALCKCLTEICPVYYSLGNHEIRFDNIDDFICELKANHVQVLNDEQEEIQINGTKLCITGLTLQSNHYLKIWKKTEFTLSYMKEHIQSSNDEVYNVLLAHNPEFFDIYEKWGADLVCSGHVHGGIAILPFIGGVIAPSLRIFPKYDYGMFEKNKSTMILTRGLGTHHIRLRFFNIPEISVIDIMK